MAHWNEQPTLFERRACDRFEPLQGLAAGQASPSVIPKSDRIFRLRKAMFP
jgi:hypothetical protein